MTQKGKRKRKRRADWTPPPKSAQALAAERSWNQFKALRDLPPVPSWRHILGAFAMALLCTGMFLAFLLPSRSVVNDLRARGVSVIAEVTEMKRNKYGDVSTVEVRFEGPGGEVETGLHDWGAKQPDQLFVGALVLVTYDSREPSRVLTSAWVADPPLVTAPLLVTGLITPLAVVGAVALPVRRWQLLKRKRQIEAF